MCYPQTQVWLKAKYGPKALRLLGWNAGSKLMFLNEEQLAKLGLIVISGGYIVVSSNQKLSSLNYEQRCKAAEILRLHLMQERKDALATFGTSTFMHDQINQMFHENFSRAKNPTIKECKVNIMIEPIRAIKIITGDHTEPTEWEKINLSRPIPDKIKGWSDNYDKKNKTIRFLRNSPIKKYISFL